MPDILIVDDNIVLTTVLEQLLSSIGHRVVGTAHSGDQAIALAKDVTPELVIMDIDMPGKLDGIEAAETLKAELNIPVIFVSTRTDKDYLRRATKVAPLGYIHKPFSLEQIMATIEMAIFRHGRENKLIRAYEKLELKANDQADQLKQANTLLGIESVEMEQQDLSLDLLMNHLGGDRTRLEAHVASYFTKLIIPLLENVKGSSQEFQQGVVIETVKAIVDNVVTPFLQRLPPEYHDFTLTELRVAALLKDKKTSKDIAEGLNLAPSTVVWHRKRIRKKLGISGHSTEKIIDHLPTIE